MAQTESQLEVYKILFGRKTIRQVIEEKENFNADEKDDQTLIQALFHTLLGKLTVNQAWTSEKTKTGLALLSNGGEQPNTILSCHSNHSCIEGFIDGGPFNKIKTIAKTTDITERQTVERDKMVTERFYVYLHMPMGSKTGILLIEKKGNSSIGTAFQLLMKEVMKTPRSAVRFERFVPQAMIEQYKEDGFVDNLTLTDNITTSLIDGEGVEPMEKTFGVTIKITPPDDHKPDYDLIQQFLDSIGNGFIKLGNKSKKLSTFSHKKGSLNNGENKYSFSIGDDLKIRPVIEIDDELQDNDLGYLKRENIKEMCENIIGQVKDEVYNVI